MEIDKENIKAVPTEKIVISEIDDDYEQQLREMTKDELLHLLNYDETDPEKIKLIKKVLKTKA